MIGPWRGDDPRPPRQPRPRFSPPLPTAYNKPDNPTGQQIYAAGKRHDHRVEKELEEADVDWAAAGALWRRMCAATAQYELGEAMAIDAERRERHRHDMETPPGTPYERER